MTDYAAVWLKREGNDAVVCVETPSGIWVEIIRETMDGPFSHICEPSGIGKLTAEAERAGPLPRWQSAILKARAGEKP